ncbi:alanine--tRNA ligase [Patescibacteria group bacterium]|nr:alanine--tRNA ligase [Patescibacteria group bacterium]
MTANELRKKYIAFFLSKGHAEIPSASVVPENDPTVLFTTAGMHPLVPYLLGEPHPSGKRLVDYQRCIRTGDIDDVGDDTHLTFFTMLGNWSLGDYFKKESIEWSFEFLTSKEWLNIPLSHLSFTVFAGDENSPFDQEAYDHWIRLGVPSERIAKLGKEDNWWGPAGKTGPCGPDTEIFYWVGEGEPQGNKETHSKEWMEIWNNVFMQFNKQEDGTLLPLAKGSVDTGMGLERTIVALQKHANVYETELFTDIIGAIETATGLSYRPHSADEDEKNATKGSTSIGVQYSQAGYHLPDAPFMNGVDGKETGIVKSMRIIADHLRAATIMVMDGVEPSNKDQGYILRRLVRRAIRHLKLLSATSSKVVIPPVLDKIVNSLEDSYPALRERHSFIYDVILKESAKFEATLNNGVKEFKRILDKKKTLSGEDAFNLYQSFGFPLEVTHELAREHGLEIDRQVFADEFKKHQDLSRQGAEKKFAGGLADHSVETTKLHTATHLLHQALRDVLGPHVEQRGSNITAERLRFDFSHGEKMTPEQVAQVEAIVKEQIAKKMPVHAEQLTVEEAKARGAIGLFEDKYAQMGGKINVYFMGDYSKEICGGPHVQNTGDLGGFKIAKEEAVSSGVRRIKAILG